jgi:hypothetical protein
MRRRQESAIERWCVKWARQHGILVSKLTDPTGAPDRAFWISGGRPIIIEFKDPQGKLTDLQSHYQEKFSKLGYDVFVVKTKEEFLEVMGNDRALGSTKRPPRNARGAGRG